jgi:hypothetical protein
MTMTDRTDQPRSIVRVPMQLLRARVKLAGLLPAQALHSANLPMEQHGIPFDLTRIKPEDLEELIDHLSDLSVDLDRKDHESKIKVRVFCEWPGLISSDPCSSARGSTAA